MPGHWLVLLFGGALAGALNTLAGGGSFLTVPLLIFAGLPPGIANATNRIGVVAQSGAAVGGFGLEGVRELAVAARFLPATLTGTLLGATLVTRVPDEWFQAGFALLMLAFLPLLWRPAGRVQRHSRKGPLVQLSFAAMGFYGGAVQAGLGIPLLMALVAVAGLDLVRANAAKVALNVVQQGLALGAFIWAGQVWWIPGLVLATGSAAGGFLASRLGARRGERFVRPVVAIAVLAMALRLLFAL